MPLNTMMVNILTILYKNLENSHPQPIPSTKIAAQIDVTLSELKQTLQGMKGAGVIETDPELQFNLITRKGLLWLNEHTSEKAGGPLQEVVRI